MDVMNSAKYKIPNPQTAVKCSDFMLCLLENWQQSSMLSLRGRLSEETSLLFNL